MIYFLRCMWLCVKLYEKLLLDLKKQIPKYYKPKVDNDNIHRKYNKPKKQEIRKFDRNLCGLESNNYTFFLEIKNIFHFDLHMFYFHAS